MADSEFEFDAFFDVISDDQKHEGNTTDTQNTSNTRTTNNTKHPFSVRLDQEYVEVIKALSWWKRISQRELIQQLLDSHLKEDIAPEKLENILRQYRDND